MLQDWHYLMRGGMVMWPLMLCGVIAVAVIIDRLMAIGLVVRDQRVLLNQVDHLLAIGDADGALALCEHSEGRIAQLVASGIRSRHLPRAAVERRLEEYALREMPVLQERLRVLDTIVTLAPLLGLLGTITGMIRAFDVLGTNLNNPVAITGGVSEALIATSVGLTIAIMALPAYNFLVERVRDHVAAMEFRATRVLNLLIDNQLLGATDEISSDRN
jgi:biopolymer transport protein ExbB